MDETKVLNEATRIVLFGSRARGNAGRDSDYDLFVLVQDGVSPAEAEKAIRLALISPDASFDIVVCTESEYKAFELAERDAESAEILRREKGPAEISAYHYHQSAFQQSGLSA